jgi:hypothetical protein
LPFKSEYRAKVIMATVAMTRRDPARSEPQAVGMGARRRTTHARHRHRPTRGYGRRTTWFPAGRTGAGDDVPDPEIIGKPADQENNAW